MPNSILLHLNGAQQGGAVVPFGVSLAQRTGARVRGLATLDTRRLENLVSTCESAAPTHRELLWLQEVQRRQEVIRDRLREVCRSDGVPCDIRMAEGDPLQLLLQESQFHDLVVTFFPAADARDASSADLPPRELLRLLHHGVQPMLILRQQEQPLQRVLLIYDGTPAAAAALRQFHLQRLLPRAAYRLLAVGASAAKAREHLTEMVAYCRQAKWEVEAGCISGNVRRVILPYAEKWDADLTVIGMPRARWRLPYWHWQANPLEQLLWKSHCAIYTTT